MPWTSERVEPKWIAEVKIQFKSSPIPNYVCAVKMWRSFAKKEWHYPRAMLFSSEMATPPHKRNNFYNRLMFMCMILVRWPM